MKAFALQFKRKNSARKVRLKKRMKGTWARIYFQNLGKIYRKKKVSWSPGKDGILSPY